MPVGSEFTSPAWARIVDSAVRATHIDAYRIADESGPVVESFLGLDKSLKDCRFAASTLSRMCTGRSNGGREVRPQRGQLIVLSLAILCLEDPTHVSWSEEQRLDALQTAIRFARQVLDEYGKPGKQVTLRDRGPQYSRTVSLFSVYGEEVLQQVEAGIPEAKVKLAILHSLTGDKDDAVFWARGVSDEDSTFISAESVRDLCGRAREYAAEYQRNRRPDVASIYLECAADAGDAVAALMRANQAELEGDTGTAQRWRKKADDLDSEGG